YKTTTILALDRLKASQESSILGFLAFRIKPDAQFDIVPDIFPDRVIMNVPGNFGSRQQKLPLPCMIQILPLANAPFHEHGGSGKVIDPTSLNTVRVILGEICNSVVRDFAPHNRSGPDLNSPRPPRLGESNVSCRPPPHILVTSRHRPVRGLDHDI